MPYTAFGPFVHMGWTPMLYELVVDELFENTASDNSDKSEIKKPNTFPDPIRIRTARIICAATK